MAWEWYIRQRSHRIASWERLLPLGKLDFCMYRARLHLFPLINVHLYLAPRTFCVPLVCFPSWVLCSWVKAEPLFSRPFLHSCGAQMMSCIGQFSGTACQIKFSSHVIEVAATQDTHRLSENNCSIRNMFSVFLRHLSLSRQRPSWEEWRLSPACCEASGESFLYLVIRLHFTKSLQEKISLNETISKTR